MDKGIFRVLYMLISSFLIGVCINLFLIPYGIAMFGTNGVALEAYFGAGTEPALNILILNLILLFFAALFMKNDKIKGYISSSLAVPFFVYATKGITSIIHVGIEDKLIIVLAASFLLGFAYSLLFKHGYAGGTVFLFEETIGTITHIHSKYYSWLIDTFTLIAVGLTLGFMNAVYSFILIILSKELILRTRFGINDSKMFFVITSKEKEVKDLIIRNIKSELSLLDVKGGFTKKSNKIITTVINTSDYYRLKEGIKAIDPKAFIVITDTYDVINRKSL